MSTIMGGDCRAWADRSRVHKMGWLRFGDEITILNDYQNWRRFEPVSECLDLLPTTDSYPDYFFNVNDIIPVEEPPITPIGPDDMELGAAVRLVFENVAFLVKYFKDLL